MRDGHVVVRNTGAARAGRLDMLTRQTVLPAARSPSATAQDGPLVAFALGPRTHTHCTEQDDDGRLALGWCASETHNSSG
jgi:hypothetical protein